MTLNAMKTCGADSFTGRVERTFTGATDTTFWIISLNVASVGVKNARHPDGDLALALRPVAP